MKPTVRYWVEWYYSLPSGTHRSMLIGSQTSKKNAIRKAVNLANGLEWRIVKETISSEVVAESKQRKGKHDKAAT